MPRIRALPSRRAALVGAALASLLHAVFVAAAPPAAPPRAQGPPRASAAAPPVATLGPHAAALEGTWEFRSLRRADGMTLVPPAATGVIVIDKGLVLAASYLQASPSRKVGSAWEGRMILTSDHFDVIPEKGYAYDSEGQPVVRTSVPPPSKGTLEHAADGLRMLRSDGTSITYESAGRRVQRDPDGTVIVHERTSLVPRVPDDLPGRQP